MASVNVQRDSQQTKILDQFYNTELVVNTQEYDVVYSYFVDVTGNKDLSKNFTANIFQISNQTQVPALTYLENLKGQDAMQLTMSMAYYLNSVRSNSTLLGVGNLITPNFYAARNVAI